MQLPIFIALFRVIQIITDEREKIELFTYAFVEQLQPIAAIINDANNQFDASLLGIIDLTKHGLNGGGIYWPAILIAALAAVLQYIQSKQITPKPDSNKRLRDIFKDSAAGKNVDQSEMNTLLTNRMIILFPFLTFAVGINFPGALVLYFATSSAVAVIQQHLLLRQDVEEMEVVADMDTKPKKQSAATKKRVDSAQEAVVVAPPKTSKKGKKKKRRR